MHGGRARIGLLALAVLLLVGLAWWGVSGALGPGDGETGLLGEGEGADASGTGAGTAEGDPSTRAARSGQAGDGGGAAGVGKRGTRNAARGTHAGEDATLGGLTLDVCDAINGERLSATVEMWGGDPAAAPSWKGLSGARVTVAPGATLRVRVSHARYLPAEGPVEMPPAGGARTLQVHLLPEAVRLRGVVVDEGGRAVDKARVRLAPPDAYGSRVERGAQVGRWRWDPDSRLVASAIQSAPARAAWGRVMTGEAFTDAAGLYQTESFPGLAILLVATHPHYFHAPATSRAACLTPREGGEAPELRLGGGGAAALVLVIDRWQEERPGRDEVPAATEPPWLLVFLHCHAAQQLLAKQAPLQEEVALWGLPPGPTGLRVFPAHLAAAPVQLDTTLDAGQTTRIALRLDPAPALCGTVYDVAGRRVPDAWVAADFRWPGLPQVVEETTDRKPAGWALPGDARMGWRINGDAWLGTVTDATGRFGLGAVPAEGAEVTVHVMGERRWNGRTSPGPPLDIRLADTMPAVIVRVKEAEWGASVWAVGSDNRRREADVRGRVGGVFGIRDVPPGRALVVAQETRLDAGTAAATFVEVSADAAALVTLELQPVGKVSAQVVGADGQPCAAAVTALAGGIEIARLDATSEPRVSVPPRLPFELRLAAPGHQPKSVPLRLEPGETRHLGQIRLEATRAR